MNEVKNCAKCGQSTTQQNHIPTKRYIEGLNRLSRTCTVCGYKWYEKTADLEPVNKPYTIFYNNGTKEVVSATSIEEIYDRVANFAEIFFVSEDPNRFFWMPGCWLGDNK